MQEDEISLFDLWDKLRAGWRYVAGGSAIGLLGAGLAVGLISPKYEAIAFVQMGQMGQMGQIGQIGQLTSVPAEPASQAIERMKTPSFQLRVAHDIGDQDWVGTLKRSSGAGSDILTLQIAKATATSASALIELKAKGVSAEAARKIADAVVLELARRHAEITKPTIDRMQSDLALAKEKRQRAEQDLESLSKLVATAGVKDDRFTQLSLMTSLRLQKEAELFSQRQMVTALETALSPPATQAAQAIEAIFVSDKPVSPKKGLLLALGLIGGLLAGIVAVFVADGWRRAKEAKRR